MLIFADLPALTVIESTSYPKQAVINLIFEPGTAISKATEQVEESLQPLSLPSEAKWEVIPLNLNESTAITYVLLGDNLSLAELSELAQSRIIPEFSKVEGVQKVKLLGDRQINKNLVSFNGQKGVALAVVKTSEGNTLEVVKEIGDLVAKLQPELGTAQLMVAETQAKYIKEATQATIDALLSAVVIAVVAILILLRNWRATLITAITIPVSLFGTFIFMAGSGFNLETLTLLALALVIGIIVDDAIVEVENITRHLETGKSPYQAALLATEEIGFTVSISTLTIVAVFLPIALMPGTLGTFFRPFGMTISVAVLTSLLAARTLSPVLAVFWLKSQAPSIKSSQNNFPLTQAYRRLLTWSLAHRRRVLIFALGISILGVALIPLIPQGFVPSLDRGEFNVFYETPLPQIKLQDAKPQNTTQKNPPSSNFAWLNKIAQNPEKILLNRSLKVGAELEQKILAIPEVKSVYTLAGYREQSNRGKIYVQLQEQRTQTTNQVQSLVRQELNAFKQAEISVEDIPFVETSEKPFNIALVGEDREQLQQTAIAIKEKISTLDTLVDVTFTGEKQSITPITHLNQDRIIYLTGNLTSGSAIGDVTKEVIAIAKPELPEGVEINVQGDSARSSKILREFSITLAIAVTLMLMVLYLPFKRWLEPLVIGLSFPLALIGSMLALLITQSDFGMISLMGVIFLLGLLDKNGILLLDYTNQLRKDGLSRSKALIETGIIRLRPILMTTCSTVCGMLPIALGWGAGSELRQPMAVTIIGGLIASSLLSLIVIPVLYICLEDKSFRKSKS